MCSNYPFISQDYDRQYDKIKYSVRFKTMSLPCWNYWYELFYVYDAKLGKIIKTLPSYEIMFDLLTPVALAHWIMGDGA